MKARPETRLRSSHLKNAASRVYKKKLLNQWYRFTTELYFVEKAFERAHSTYKLTEQVLTSSRPECQGRIQDFLMGGWLIPIGHQTIH